MLLILAAVYLFQSSIYAAPLSTAPLVIFPRDSTPSTFSSSDQCTCPNQRSVWDIVWSCLATIFACSWISVHPNMAGLGEARWKVALRRLELMIWAILAPELIISWAMQQWFGARNLAQLYREKKWTKTHGYFIQMGGFMLYKRDQAQGILHPEEMKELYEGGKIDFPAITKEEIQDRSKADGLAKIIVVGQTTWFIAQCLARSIQGLVLTQLELVTLAFAFLNGFMYFLWWDKPMNVDCPVPVYLLENPRERPKILSMTDITTSENFFKQLKKSLNDAVHVTVSYFDHVRSWILTLVEDEGILKILYAIFIMGPGRGVIKFLDRFWEMVEHNPNSVKTRRRRIATFYALEPGFLEWSRYQIVICGIAIAFGAIHCAGWFLTLPSYPERLIWQTSSAIITGVPFLVLITNVLNSCQLNKSFNDVLISNIAAARTPPITVFQKILHYGKWTLWVPTFTLGVPAYMISRVLLLVTALIELRALTPSALEVVEWTSFIPHI